MLTFLLICIFIMILNFTNALEGTYYGQGLSKHYWDNITSFEPQPHIRFVNLSVRVTIEAS